MEHVPNITVAALAQRVDRVSLRDELSCYDETCLEALLTKFLKSPVWFCDGGANIYEGGSRIGHVLPGALMIFWAAHWLLGFVRSFYEAQARGQPFRSQSCYRFLWFPERWPMEAVVKATLPFIAIFLELYWLHSTYRRLFCSDDAPRAGHFIGNHINNWQHASLYPGFVISGVVDLVSLVVELPQGTPQVFLSLSFLHEALLLGLHKKHAAMDIIIHQLLACTALVTAIFPALEVVWPHNPLLVAGRIAAACLHGSWLYEAAHILFDKHPTWDTHRDSDIAPVLYSPILLVSLVMGIMLCIVAAFVIGFAIYRPRHRVQWHGKAERESSEPASYEGWSLQQHGEDAAWAGASGRAGGGLLG